MLKNWWSSSHGPVWIFQVLITTCLDLCNSSREGFQTLVDVPTCRRTPVSISWFCSVFGPWLQSVLTSHLSVVTRHHGKTMYTQPGVWLSTEGGVSSLSDTSSQKLWRVGRGAADGDSPSPPSLTAPPQRQTSCVSCHDSSTSKDILDVRGACTAHRNVLPQVNGHRGSGLVHSQSLVLLSCGSSSKQSCSFNGEDLNPQPVFGLELVCSSLFSTWKQSINSSENKNFIKEVFLQLGNAAETLPPARLLGNLTRCILFW